jgi:vancomycin resistance protein YoaR
VASTLYAAALEAGLTVVARQAHSRPSSYISPGRDATVSFDRKVDLVLRNDAPHPLRVSARAGDGRLAVTIEGTAGPAPAIEILEQRSAEGLIVTVLRSVEGGSPELVSRDVYRVRSTIVSKPP